MDGFAFSRWSWTAQHSGGRGWRRFWIWIGTSSDDGVFGNFGYSIYVQDMLRAPLNRRNEKTEE